MDYRLLSVIFFEKYFVYYCIALTFGGVCVLILNEYNVILRECDPVSVCSSKTSFVVGRLYSLPNAVGLVHIHCKFSEISLVLCCNLRE